MIRTLEKEIKGVQSLIKEHIDDYPDMKAESDPNPALPHLIFKTVSPDLRTHLRFETSVK